MPSFATPVVSEILCETDSLMEQINGCSALKCYCTNARLKKPKGNRIGE